MRASPRVADGEQSLLGLHAIDLVEEAEARCRTGPEHLREGHIRVSWCAGVSHDADEVHVGQRALDGGLHELTQLALGRVNPRRIDEDDLGAREIADTRDPVARCLWPR